MAFKSPTSRVSLKTLHSVFVEKKNFPFFLQNLKSSIEVY